MPQRSARGTPAPSDRGNGTVRKRRSARAIRRYVTNPQIVIGSVLILIFVVLAGAAPLLAPYSFDESDILAVWQTPSAEHLLGTDRLGRDVLSRLLYGSRVSLVVGVGSMAIAVVIGLLVGAVAGFAGGWLDSVLMQVINIMLAFPALLLMILLAVVLGSGVQSMVLAIGLTTWAQLARIVRAEFLRVRDLDFVVAARATGNRQLRLGVRHILPNALAPVVVFATFGIPFAIMSEAGLGFIGLGVNPPTPSWGVMLNDGFRSFRSFPTLILFPSLALSLTMFAFVLFGNGLRDVLDPKL